MANRARGPRGRITEHATGYAVTFAFDPAIVRAIRMLPGRSYDACSKTWRFPKTPEATRELVRFGRAYNIADYEKLEQALGHELPHPRELWWNDDVA